MKTAGRLPHHESLDNQAKAESASRHAVTLLENQISIFEITADTHNVALDLALLNERSARAVRLSN
jgi:hypothetical protein